MNRDQLISEVKEEYARIASSESRQLDDQSTVKMTPEAYYEMMLSNAISEISNGTFDHFNSGKEIVTAIANDKHWLSNLQY